MKTWMVYMLRCKDKSLYTGITVDLEKRLKAHQNGTASKYTRSRLPVELVWNEESESESTARKLEFEMKKLSKQQKEQLIK